MGCRQRGVFTGFEDRYDCGCFPCLWEVTRVQDLVNEKFRGFSANGDVVKVIVVDKEPINKPHVLIVCIRILNIVELKLIF
ncbi:hypothetical protein TNCV_2721421 [Trichonephila clavipes]|nr:hypothetical protein TNCV_2721421 [Trichonephila clavipes]